MAQSIFILAVPGGGQRARQLALVVAVVISGAVFSGAIAWWWRAVCQKAHVQEGEALVAAIYAFRDRTGLFPRYLQDALDGSADRFGRTCEARVYAPFSWVGPWRYHWLPQSGFSLSRRTWWGSYSLVHTCERNEERKAWNVRSFDGVRGSNLRDAEGLSPEAKVAQAAELQRRIAREPLLVGHWHAAVTTRVASGEFTEAQAAAWAFRGRFERHWWPRLALLDINDRLGRREASLRECEAWINEAPVASSIYALARWCYEHGERDLAVHALRRLLEKPLAVPPEVLSDGIANECAEDYLYDPCVIAYRCREYALAVDLSRHVAPVVQKSRNRHIQLLSLRAAAYLILKDFGSASCDAHAAKSALVGEAGPPSRTEHLCDAVLAACADRSKAAQFDVVFVGPTTWLYRPYY